MEVLDHFNYDVFVRSFGVWVIEARGIYQSHLTNGALFEATRHRFKGFITLEYTAMVWSQITILGNLVDNFIQSR